MPCLIVPVLIALLAYGNYVVLQVFCRRSAGGAWWIVWTCACLAGAGLGYWSGFYFEYQLSPSLRVCGFPVPGAFFHWEGPLGEERWIDFITPAPVLYSGSNVPLLGLLAGQVVGLPFWLWSRLGARIHPLP